MANSLKNSIFNCICWIFSKKYREELKSKKMENKKIHLRSPIIKKRSLRIVLDTQHAFKPKPKHKDRGASYKGLYESDLIWDYFQMTKTNLEKEGHQVFVNDLEKKQLVGWYSQRHQWVNLNSIDLYLAGHLNSGIKPGSYSLVMIKYDANQDIFNLANSLSEKFKTFLSLRFSQVWKVFPEDDPLTKRKEDRGWCCIDGVECPAFLLEPIFLNNPDSFDLLKTGVAQNLISLALTEFVREFVEVLNEKNT